MTQLLDKQIAVIQEAIAAQETLRPTLGDVIVDVTIAALEKQLTALSASPKVTQKRKQVTILFADVSNFTAISEAMDAEDVNDIMNGLWQRLDRIIMGHNGRIDKHMGDGVMAIWGADIAREDDVEQAIRAALVMQAELTVFGSEQKVDMTMRVGIHTGPVLLSDIGTIGEFTAIGDTVNTASRLQQAAPVGAVLISHTTYQHVQGLFEVQGLPPVLVKGKREPIKSYTVDRVKLRVFHTDRRGVEGIETRMIGREEELQQLQRAWQTAVAQQQRQMVTVWGEAGVGKSRLLTEFDKWVQQQPQAATIFRAHVSQVLRHLPYALIRDLFIFRCQIQESDRPGVVWQKIEQGVKEVLVEDTRSRMKAHFIGQLLGFDFSHSRYLGAGKVDARQLHDRALVYLSEYFGAAARQRPLLLLLEDVQWVDDSSLAVLRRLTQVMADDPLLIVCAARPALWEKRPLWAHQQPFHTCIELQPLSLRDSHHLVTDILQKVKNLPRSLRDLIVKKAAGNPFYVEELIKILIDDGVIEKQADAWQVVMDKLHDVRIPSTLTGILQARLDKLSRAERANLQRAAVVGMTFWDQAVEYLGSESDNALSALQSRELIFQREPSVFAGTQEYIFKHAILHQVTYESVLKRMRRVYHALVAKWLIEHSSERIGEYIGIIARHLERAGQTERAAVYFRQAGEQASAQYAHAEAIAYLNQAIALMPKTQYADRYELLSAREKVYHIQGQRQAQKQDLDTLEKLAHALKDDQLTRRQTEMALRRAHYAQITGDYTTAVAVAQRAIQLAQTGQDMYREAAGYLQWGQALWSQGSYQSAQQQLSQALTLAQVIPSRQLEAKCLRELGFVYQRLGDVAQARAACQQALQIFHEIEDKEGEAGALSNLGDLALAQGDYTAAKTYCDQALYIYQEIGNRQGESRALGHSGIVLAEQGNYPGALAYHQQALQVCQEIGDRRGEALRHNSLGFIYHRLGAYAEAQAYYDQSYQIFQATGDRGGQGLVLSNLGLLAHHLGDHEATVAYSQQALQTTPGSGGHRGFAWHNLGHALTGLGRFTEARDAYEQALTIRRQAKEEHLAVETVAGLAAVCLHQEDLTTACRYTAEILTFLDTNSLAGMEEPFRVYWTCYWVLQANQDVRATILLSTAYHLLQEQAVKIDDKALRASFLENVAVHQQIVYTFSMAGETQC